MASVLVGWMSLAGACVGGLLAWFIGRKSKSPFVYPLSLFAGTKSTDFHGWYVFVGVGGAGCVFWLLLSFAGRRRSKRQIQGFPCHWCVVGVKGCAVCN